MVESEAQGRLPGIRPVAVVDIGSNSVRLVIYEGLLRSPNILFNEKALCGLGKGVATTGQMDPEGVERAIKTLYRFRRLCDQVGAEDVHVLATAAARDATNGPAFIKDAEAALKCKLKVLTGEEEAKFASFGVISGVYNPDGIVGDLGGGSLELVDINKKDQKGITLPLGGLRLQDESGGDLDKARKIAKSHISKVDLLSAGKGRQFYAVGGTWRAIAKLHMEATDYPMHMMQGYEIGYSEMMDFLDDVLALDEFEKDTLRAVSKNRRNLMPFGALTMQEVLKRMKPERIAFSAQGVREGYLYSLLDKKNADLDPLLEVSREFSILRARSPIHAQELVDFTESAFPVFGIKENKENSRYRAAACYLADISWRAHPDYRGLQALNIISNGSFASVSHPGRVYIALTNYYRYEGLSDDGVSRSLIDVATPDFVFRAKLLGAILRVLYLFSASVQGAIPKLMFKLADKKSDADIYLCVPKSMSDFLGERLANRIAQLERLVDKKIEIKII
ncbi:exopolyphosphatase [Lentilitoribacter sp. Alg239-R112]|jgi:exopolyphosphatase/guanosine-5'-triphosphate,3'-diphosphate pyrophosphatase|uniref:exopolyphosphatase n=1 Tax=Lentilitoribacter sp. Alg239-R112 TaxID=2305987 RepID=UPI0013A6DB49|nr:exopolyphosphatase [Lentilitoribacter sp. Alg239-R112]